MQLLLYFVDAFSLEKALEKDLDYNLDRRGLADFPSKEKPQGLTPGSHRGY